MARVAPRYSPWIGGTERHTEAVASGLAAQGVAVEVVTTDPTGSLPRAQELDGVTVHRFATIANDEIGRAHVRTPVPTAHLVCRLLLEKKKIKHTTSTTS